jgi:predicted  nucleic acid-binding Zn-ribbon protein
MSTAGKVLIVLVMLMTFVWVVLSAGVARVNTNANTRLHDLTEQVEKLEGQVKDAQDEVASLLTQTSQTQENIDREYTLLRAKQSDLERARSHVAETLSGAKYELEIVEGTVKGAQTDLEHRTTEHQEQTKLLEKERADVQELIAACGKQRDLLASLRKDFESRYHANIEMLGKAASKNTQARAGSTN